MLKDALIIDIGLAQWHHGKLLIVTDIIWVQSSLIILCRDRPLYFSFSIECDSLVFTGDSSTVQRLPRISQTAVIGVTQ